jgi:hypothetical protein
MGSIQYVLVLIDNGESQVYKLNAVTGDDLKRPKTKRKHVNFQKAWTSKNTVSISLADSPLPETKTTTTY